MSTQLLAREGEGPHAFPDSATSPRCGSCPHCAWLCDGHNRSGYVCTLASHPGDPAFVELDDIGCDRWGDVVREPCGSGMRG